MPKIQTTVRRSWDLDVCCRARAIREKTAFCASRSRMPSSSNPSRTHHDRTPGKFFNTAEQSIFPV